MNTQELKTTLTELTAKLSPEDQKKLASVISAVVTPPEPEITSKLWFEDPEIRDRVMAKLGEANYRKFVQMTKTAMDKHAEGVKVAGDAVTFGRLQCHGFMGEMLKICSELIQKSQDEKDPDQKAAQAVLSILGGA